MSKTIAMRTQAVAIAFAKAQSSQNIDGTEVQHATLSSCPQADATVFRAGVDCVALTNMKFALLKQTRGCSNKHGH